MEFNLDIKIKGNKLEQVLREIMINPEPIRNIRLNDYIRNMGKIRDDAHYYRAVAKKLYKRIYNEEWKE